jgi:hypothetical protein
MIKIFTIDPVVFDSLDNISELIEYFGIEKLRMIWSYPSSWVMLIKEVIKTNFKNRERKRAYNKLEKIYKSVIEIPPNYICDDSNISLDNWLNKADELYQIKKYEGIISDKNPNSQAYICKIDNLEYCSTLNNDSSFKVKRVDEDLSKAVAPLLYFATEIHFVDKYFHFLNPYHIRPLRSFIKEIFSDLRLNQISKITYHTGDSALSDNIERVLKSELDGLIPENVALRIVRWPDEKLHNRFLLTNVGGINFQHGLCDWDNGNSIEYDDISPIPLQACRLKNADGCNPFMNYENYTEYTEIIEFE